MNFIKRNGGFRNILKMGRYYERESEYNVERKKFNDLLDLRIEMCNY